MATPKNFRGRCVLVLGTLAPGGEDFPTPSLFRLDGVNGDTSIEVGYNLAWDNLLKGSEAGEHIAVLGTLQGVRDGMPYVVGVRGWTGSTTSGGWS